MQLYMMTSLKHNNDVTFDDHVREFQYNQFMQPLRDSLGKIAWVR